MALYPKILTLKKHILFFSITLLLVWTSPAMSNAASISSRTRIATIEVTAAINPGRADNIGAFWTFADLRSIVLSPSPNGRSKVGWHDSEGNIHVTPLTSQDERAAGDLIIGDGKLFDLVAHDDGFAVLTRKSNRMYIESYNSAGTRLFSTELTDDDDRVDDWHTGKLAYNGVQYAAYFAIHGTAGFSEGHEGDKLKFIDSAGGVESGGWEWGCSHSMDQRLLFSDTTEMPFCISDCYPGKGIYLKNNYEISAVDGNCAGITKARFGQAATADGHGLLVYLSIDNSRTHSEYKWSILTVMA